MLYTTAVNESLAYLPSPESLKGKVIVKVSLSIFPLLPIFAFKFMIWSKGNWLHVFLVSRFPSNEIITSTIFEFIIICGESDENLGKFGIINKIGYIGFHKLKLRVPKQNS